MFLNFMTFVFILIKTLIMCLTFLKQVSENNDIGWYGIKEIRLHNLGFHHYFPISKCLTCFLFFYHWIHTLDIIFTNSDFQAM